MAVLPSVRRFECSLFVVLVLCALAVFDPLSGFVQQKLAGVQRVWLGLVEEYSGLRFQYDSLSPSVLRAVTLRNVRVREAVRGEQVAVFSKIVVAYNIFSLFGSNPVRGIRALHVHDGAVDVDLYRHRHVKEKLQKLFSKDGEMASFFADLREIDVRVHNTAVTVRSDSRRAHLSVPQGRFSFAETGASFALSCEAEYVDTRSSSWGPLYTHLDASGVFETSFTSGSATLELAPPSGSFFSVPTLTLVAIYADDLFKFHTARGIYPMEVSGQWNTATGACEASVRCENFRPLKWARLRDTHVPAQGMQELSVSGNVQVGYTPIEQWRWSADVHAHTPYVVLAPGYQLEDVVATLQAHGDPARIQVEKICVRGSNLDVDGAFELTLDRWIPSGVLTVHRLPLLSGAYLSAQVRFRPQGVGFVCTVPRIQVGEAFLEDVALSVRVDPAKTDFRLVAADSTGRYECDGSYLAANAGQSRFLEAHVAFESVNVGALYQMVAACTSPQGASTLVTRALVPLQSTADFYVSSDFRDISYNCVRLVLASDEIADLYALLSVQGTAASFSVTDISLLCKGLEVQGNVMANFEHGGDALFESVLSINSVPYRTRGVYADRTLTVYGDYDFSVVASFDERAGVTGTFQVQNLPVPLSQSLFDCDSSFAMRSAHSWEVRFHHLHLRSGAVAAGGSEQIETVLRLAGVANQAGALFDQVFFGSRDRYLAGTASFAVVPRTGQHEQARYETAVRLASEDAQEQVQLNAQVTVGEHVYVDSSGRIDNVDVGRFVAGQGERSRVTGSWTVLGTMQDMSGQVQVDSLELIAKGVPFHLRGGCALDDGTLALLPTQVTWGSHQFADLAGEWVPGQARAWVRTTYSGAFEGQPTHATCTLTLAGSPVDSGKATSALRTSFLTPFLQTHSQYTISAEFEHWRIATYEGEKNRILVVRDPGVWALYAGEHDEITGFMLDDGSVSLQVAQSLPVHFFLNGSLSAQQVDVQIQDIFVDLARVWAFTGIRHVRVHEGVAVGNVTVSGTRARPVFEGKLRGKEVVASAPGYAPERFGPGSIDIVAHGSTLIVPYTEFPGPTARLWGECVAQLNGFYPDEVVIKCGTVGDALGAIQTDNLLFAMDGSAGCDLELRITPQLLSINGKARFDRGYFLLNFSGIEEFYTKYADSAQNFQMNLLLSAGNKVEFRWPRSDFPILRTLLHAQEPFEFIADPVSGSFYVRGFAHLKGGEFFWIKRNFYLREGTIHFARDTQTADPRISFRAELKDRDTQGRPVSLILSAEDQVFSKLAPKLRCDPPVSEQELAKILGQVVLGDLTEENIEQNVASIASDILTQWGIMKRVEDKIRSFLDLDAFSFRTYVLQNAIFGNLFNKDRSKPLTVGNYFDNTSLYVGRRLGRAVYADALLHLSQYDPLAPNNLGIKKPAAGSLLFRPELGLEFATPFFSLRWASTPTRLDSLFVSDTSMRVSWSFAY